MPAPSRAPTPTRSAPSSRRTSTSKGCRSARAAACWSVITFPADGEYVFSGRLLKTVAEGLVGVEGHETPHQFIVTIDGKQVFSAPIGGKEDHEAATENKPVAREEFDKRMTSPRIKVTAGLHEVGFTFIERPTQEQNMWQPVAARQPGSAQPFGYAAAAQRHHRRARTTPPASSDIDVASEAVRLHAARRRRRKRRAPTQILSTVARRAFRRPVDEGRHRRAAGVLSARSARRAATSTPAFAPASRGFSPVPSFLFRSEADPAALAAGARASRQRSRAGEPAVVLPLEQHSGR